MKKEDCCPVVCCRVRVHPVRRSAMAGTAANVATSWQTSTTAVENFNFGNAFGTSSRSCPNRPGWP